MLQLICFDIIQSKRFRYRKLEHFAHKFFCFSVVNMTCSKRTENKENVRPPNTLDRAVSTDQEVSSPHQNFTDAVEAGDRPRFLSRPHASGSGSDGRGASGSGGDGRASPQASAFSPQESISEGYSFSRFRQPLQDISNMENHEIGGSQNPHRVGPQRQLTTAPTYQRSFGFDHFRYESC